MTRPRRHCARTYPLSFGRPRSRSSVVPHRDRVSRAHAEVVPLHTPAIGVESHIELALRPGFSARARMPPTARACVTRREAGVTGFDCGAGAVLLRALSHRSGGRVPI